MFSLCGDGGGGAAAAASVVAATLADTLKIIERNVVFLRVVPVPVVQGRGGEEQGSGVRIVAMIQDPHQNHYAGTTQSTPHKGLIDFIWSYLQGLLE